MTKIVPAWKSPLLRSLSESVEISRDSDFGRVPFRNGTHSDFGRNKMTTEYPPFQLGKSRFDQSTFYGRWRHFMTVIDPRTLFIQKEKAEWSKQVLEKYKNGTLSSKFTDEQLWEAQRVAQAIYHPDTGERIFRPFRMAGFVPFGSPIVVGLLLPNPTFKATIFWQWLNQSHNACVNYANRNATKETPMERFIAGYVGAVTSAVTIALGLGALIKKADRFSPATKMFVQRFVPFPAVAVASTCNVVLMRNNELSEGIEVVDEQNNVLGTSKVAARKALLETAITRMFLPAPILLIPPAIMHFVEKTDLIKYSPKYKLGIHATVVTLSFGLALPVAIALFPQYSKIKTSELEKDLQEKIKSSEVYYNKGL